MINIFNRREIFLTRNLVDLNKFCDKLKTNKIEYITRTNSITNPGRSHGIPNIKSDYAYQYRVIVDKKNVKIAKDLI